MPRKERLLQGYRGRDLRAIGIDLHEVTASESLDELFRRVLDAHADDYDPWLYRYFGRFASSEEVSRYRRYISGLLEFGRVKPPGTTVLDAGCGFGFTLVLLRWLGASQVYGIDTSEPMIQTIRAYLPLLPHDLSDRIHVTEASVLDMPFDDDSFDIIVSLEAMSHYRNVGAFIAEAARILRSGGTLLIHDGNNGRNPRLRREKRALWEEFETGTPGPHAGQRERQGSYQLRREEIIRDAFPGLSDDVVTDLALRTSFMSEAQIIAAVTDHLEGGARPASFYDGSDAPVDPNSGAVHERVFDPYALAAQIRTAGFSTRVAGYWGGSGGNPLIGAGNRLLGRASRVTISTAPSFRIAARLDD
jgi:SAM-dependent methyltransferase